MNGFENFAMIGGVIFLLVVVIATTIATVAHCYKKISPNVVAVITGRKYKHKVSAADGGQENIVERGFRYVVGGGFFLVPIVEKMQEMSLNLISVQVKVHNVPDQNGALVSVDAIANVKILGDAGTLPLAIERFLGNTEEQIKEIIKQTLEGNLRGIVAGMEVEGLLRERQAFTQHVLDEAGSDLGKMGLGIDNLKIQNITDERGYIESLGKRRTAEVVRDATVGEAEALRDADIKSAAARQEGETAKAKSLEAISDAERQRDVTIAENEAQVAAQRAQIPIAAAIAEAEKKKDLNIAQVGAEEAEVQAQIKLEGVRAERNAAELQATVVVKAEKQREATVIDADAKRQAAELEGEAFRLKSEKEGAGEKAKQGGIADGRKALAEASQAELVAVAEGNKAQLLATAAGKQADLEAVAAGELAMAGAIKAKLLAEAEGTLKRAEAFKELDEAGRFLMILEALPPVIEALGSAGERIVKPMAEAIGQGLGNVDEIRIVDLGGGANGGKSLVNQFAMSPVETMFGLWQKVQAAGMEPLARELAGKAGFDLDKLFPPTVDGTAREVPPEAPAAPSAEASSEASRQEA